ncbi:adenosylcobinamide amidohydrolase [Bacterioplanoides sp.]|uniref:adenosylcobinamide amidohydrolase n=1 Tax=Bacterioplanoides sp. TaxID=2066072 RepID=UPI003B5A64BE
MTIFTSSVTQPLTRLLLLSSLLLTGCSTFSNDQTEETVSDIPASAQSTTPSTATGNWTELQNSANFIAQRNGRFFKVQLKTPHRVISTSSYNGGEQTDLNYLVNHQSMEARADMRWVNRVLQNSPEQYQQLIADEIGIPADKMALMGTAANMQLLAHQQQIFTPDGSSPDASSALVIDVYATAGVRGNAMRAGDPTSWYETPEGNKKHSPKKHGSKNSPQKKSEKNKSDMHGTINIMVLINQPVSAGAMNKLQIITTEAKSAAMNELAVSSRYTRHLATGTGTDQMIIASPLAKDGEYSLNSGSGHLKLGEQVGSAVRKAVLQALVWQNGLPTSAQATIYNALGRFGGRNRLTEKNLMSRLLPYLPEAEQKQAERNPYSFSHENRVVASAYALASVLDRFAYSTLTPNAKNETIRDFVAQAAVAISGRSDRYAFYWQQLNAPISVTNVEQSEHQAVELFIQALAIGWLDKWPEKLLSAQQTSKKIAFLHLDPKLGDLDGNTQLLTQAIQQAAAAGAEWILTPELALSGYRFTLAIGEDWIQPAPDQWTRQLQTLADDLDVVLFLGHVEQASDGNKYNTLFVIGRDGEIIGKHHKIQTIPVSEAWSTKGTEPQLVTVDNQQVGLLICADAYRDSHANKLKQAGADLIISAANWAPGEYGPRDSWRQRSLETGLPLFVNNRTGLEVRPPVEGTTSQFDLRQAISAVAYQGKHQVEHQNSGNSILLVNWDFETQALVSQRSFELMTE